MIIVLFQLSAFKHGLGYMGIILDEHWNDRGPGLEQQRKKFAPNWKHWTISEERVKIAPSVYDEKLFGFYSVYDPNFMDRKKQAWWTVFYVMERIDLTQARLAQTSNERQLGLLSLSEDSLSEPQRHSYFQGLALEISCSLLRSRDDSNFLLFPQSPEWSYCEVDGNRRSQANSHCSCVWLQGKLD